MFGRHQSRTSSTLERQNSVVFGNTLSQRIGSNWRRYDGIRVDNFPRMIHYIGNSHWDSKDDGQNSSVNLSNFKEGSSSCPCTMTLYGNSRKRTKLCSEFFKRCNIRQKVSMRMLVVSGTRLWEKVVWNSRQQATWWMEQSCWDHDDQFRWKQASFFKPPVFWEEENWKVKVVDRKPFTTTEVKKPLTWFFARLFLSISSVSAESQKMCKRALHPRHRETCCKIISRNSQNFLKIRNCRNIAKMLYS